MKISKRNALVGLVSFSIFGGAFSIIKYTLRDYSSRFHFLKSFLANSNLQINLNEIENLHHLNFLEDDLDELIELDFEKGDIVNVNGWVLSRIEVNHAFHFENIQ